MMTRRRYHLFNDYLRTRFEERLQRVTLSGGLLCPAVGGREECDFCREAAAGDPGYGRGIPPHEQIRRGVNFSRRHGDQVTRLMVSLPALTTPCPPADHLKATLDVITRSENVVVVAVSLRPECLDPEVCETLAGYATPEREIWLDVEGIPEDRPAAGREGLRVGVLIDLGHPGQAAAAVRQAVEAVQRLRPDSVGLVAPAVIEGTPEARQLEQGRLEEVELEDFATRAAEFLEQIPASVAVHPVVLHAPADQVVGPRWVLNRQKVEEAVGRALEARSSSQGARLAPA